MDMDETQCESGQSQPVDPDLAWTRWALRSLAEVVDINLRTARMTAAQQQATPVAPVPPPDFALMQARIGRSVRLTIAMSGRIRDAYREGKAGRVPERAPATLGKTVPAEETAPTATPRPAEPRRTEPWESLTESETPEVELETLANEEEAEERPDRDPDASGQRDWDGDAAVEAADALPDPSDTVAESRPEDGWDRSPDEPDTGRLRPTPSTPDSS
jgi:hypothetical protein